MKSAVFYIRSRGASPTMTIEQQLEACQQYAEEHQIRVIHIYVDQCTLPETNPRTSWLRLMNDSSNLNYDYVITTDPARITRDWTKLHNYRTTLHKNGKELIFTSCPSSNDTWRTIALLNDIIHAKQKENQL